VRLSRQTGGHRALPRRPDQGGPPRMSVAAKPVMSQNRSSGGTARMVRCWG
jgi:hypothetical protein